MERYLLKTKENQNRIKHYKIYRSRVEYRLKKWNNILDMTPICLPCNAKNILWCNSIQCLTFFFLHILLIIKLYVNSLFTIRVVSYKITN